MAKSFFAAIAVLAVLALTLTSIPYDIAREAARRMNTESLLRLVREKTLGKSPIEERAELIDRISGTIQLLERELDKPRGGGAKELIAEAEDLLEALRVKNPEQNSILSATAERAISQLVPEASCPDK